MGCQGPAGQSGNPGDPKASEALLAHWQAMHKGDWRGAYERIHPDLKAAGLTLKRFTALHAKRLTMKGAPQKIEIAGSEQAGDDIVVSYDLYAVPAAGGEPVAITPRRKATLRKSGSSWALMTHDILTIQL
jgi:hypothetical protein